MNDEKFIARNHCLKEHSNVKKTLMYSIRIFMFEKFDVWDWMDLFPYRFRLIYYTYISPFFKPCNQKIRKVIPRTWMDISHLMIDVNFEFIKVFYEDEYKADIVDWESTEHHKEFAQWLEDAYTYITKDRPQLQKDLEAAYPVSRLMEEMFKPIEDENGRKMFQMVDDGIPYEVKYKEVNRIEKLIDDIDTEILTEFIKWRHYFWT
jgi:hypothetical protein